MNTWTRSFPEARRTTGGAPAGGMAESNARPPLRGPVARLRQERLG